MFLGIPRIQPDSIMASPSLFFTIGCLVLFINAIVTIACPVIVKTNHTNLCECTTMLDIYCSGLQKVPTFYRNDIVYNGLYMSRQNIRNLPNVVFFNLMVKKIELNFNPIGDNIEVNALAGLERTLEQLYMGGCRIRTLPTGMLIGLEAMKILHLWGNQIRDLPPNWFKGAANLVVLLLWGNQIRTVDIDSFTGLTSLRTLDLERNQITKLDQKMFRDLTNLQSLHLGENNLITVNGETFTYMSNLKVLNLDANGLEFIWPKAFDGLRNLMILSLQDNAIDLISDQVLGHLRNLSVLRLQNNHIKHLWAKNFDGLRALQSIDLSHNILTELPEGVFRQAPKLLELYLDNNNLTSLTKCILHKRSRQNLRTLSLVGNPIVCDCEMSWTVNLQARGVSVWGTCHHTPKEILLKLTPITYKSNYYLLSEPCNDKDCRM